MIITTDSTIEGKSIVENKGDVYSEVSLGEANVQTFFEKSVGNLVSKISSSYKSKESKAKEDALANLEKEAEKVGANAVINVSTEYRYVFGMRVLSLKGVAVVIE